jgi:hypothetical protein
VNASPRREDDAMGSGAINDTSRGAHHHEAKATKVSTVTYPSRADPDFTVATIPACIASDSRSHATMTAESSGSFTAPTIVEDHRHHRTGTSAAVRLVGYDLDRSMAGFTGTSRRSHGGGT